MHKKIFNTLVLILICVISEASGNESWCFPNYWTGFYVGAHGGYAWANPPVKFSPLPNEEVAGIYSLKVKPHLRGGFAGLQGGYNFQTACYVVGFEADITFPAINGSHQRGPLLATSGGFFPETLFSAKEQIELFGTIRQRFGFVLRDRFFFYMTGGIAWGLIHYEANVRSFLTGEEFPSSFRKTKLGWSIGGGVEYALWKKFSLKGEYLYVDLMRAKRTADPTIFPSSFQAEYHFLTNIHTARIGLNYQFGWCR